MTTSPIHSFEKIVTELTELQKPGAWDKQQRTFPGLLSTGGPEGSILINEEVDREISRVAGWMLDQRPASKRQYTLREWREAVRRAFGPALIQLDLGDTVAVNGKKLKKLVEEAVNDAGQVASTKSTAMGCTLLARTLTDPLIIGPVKFESRLAWLSRIEKEGLFTRQTCDRIARGLAGRRLRKLKNWQRERFERHILDVLADAEMVCTVETQGLASEMAELRAITGARLAQAAISLMWSRPSTAFEGFRLAVDHGSRQVQTLKFGPGPSVSGGDRSVGSRHGPDVKEQEWNGLLRDWKDRLVVAGRMIECWTSAPAYDRASRLIRNLAQAIYFFWEACHDESNLMAIVKFTAVLEALAPGNSTSIIDLAKARLGYKDSSKVVRDKNIKQVVEWIYSMGRSRTLHGSNTDILHDWSDARAVAESLARHCLVACMEWAVQNPTETDPKKLLE